MIRRKDHLEEMKAKIVEEGRGANYSMRGRMLEENDDRGEIRDIESFQGNKEDVPLKLPPLWPCKCIYDIGGASVVVGDRPSFGSSSRAAPS
ncbi:hypothetical protein V6N13_108936 [Hibiscus sabdariffa]